MFYHSNVPYFSQWSSPDYNSRIINECCDPCEDPTWKNSGFVEEDEYRFWSRRLCGVACLESIIDYAKRHKPTRFELLRDALLFGVYEIDGANVKGLIYKPFSEWVANRFQFDVEIFCKCTAQSLAARVNERSFVIASVSSEIRAPEKNNSRRGGHLVLVHGFDSKFVRFHNPSGIDPHMKNAILSIDDFSRFFAFRGMLINI